MASTTETQPRRADYDGRTVDELVAEIKRQQFGEGGLIRCVSEGEGRGFLPRFEDHVLIRITEERESMDEKTIFSLILNDIQTTAKLLPIIA